MKILVIDDEPIALKILVHQLRELGYPEVRAHASARDAIAAIETARDDFRLVFCDLQMPGIDGVEFVRLLAKIGYEGGLVLVSGEDERILLSAVRLGVAHQLDVLGALHKPVTLEQLQRLLESNLLRSGASVANRRKKGYDASELSRAITGGELVNYYQPKIELRERRVVGVEALVRWQHPHDGMVFPDQFVDLAEENGLIEDLTRCVLAGALEQARRWRDHGIDIHVAVNVSMENLQALDFPEFVAEEANRWGIAMSRLVLEVTESRLTKDARAPLDILTRLRLKRVGISIDDFGTGHSSLAQLRDLPFDELKVDRGFVHGAHQDSALQAILLGSLGMARQLGIRTVGEGVEDREDLEFLRIQGCNMAQGYYIARPMPAADFPQWTRDWELRRATV